jgi:hypothetical protein
LEGRAPRGCPCGQRPCQLATCKTIDYSLIKGDIPLTF